MVRKRKLSKKRMKKKEPVFKEVKPKQEKKRQPSRLAMAIKWSLFSVGMFGVLLLYAYLSHGGG